jgi:3-oxocholest-4-en-26-oate---CoA ligase
VLDLARATGCQLKGVTLSGNYNRVGCPTGGEKAVLFPDEVERVLIDHPGVVDVLVVGKPDPRWAERGVAIAQGRDAAIPTLDDIRRHARTRLAGYKLPQEVVVVDQVRRLPSGKPDLQWAKALVSTSSVRRCPRLSLPSQRDQVL